MSGASRSPLVVACRLPGGGPSINFWYELPKLIHTVSRAAGLCPASALHPGPKILLVYYGGRLL